MGRKIFVSYKYADDQVENFIWYINATVRDYVDKFEERNRCLSPLTSCRQGQDKCTATLTAVARSGI